MDDIKKLKHLLGTGVCLSHSIIQCDLSKASHLILELKMQMIVFLANKNLSLQNGAAGIVCEDGENVA